MTKYKKEIHSNGANVKDENVHVQVTTICLIKDDYARWSSAITMGIAGRGRFAYIAGQKPPLTENDPS